MTQSSAGFNTEKQRVPTRTRPHESTAQRFPPRQGNATEEIDALQKRGRQKSAAGGAAALVARGRNRNAPSKSSDLDQRPWSPRQAEQRAAGDRTVLLQEAEDLGSGDALDLGDAVAVTQDDTDLGRRHTLLGKLADVLLNISGRGLEPGGGCTAVRAGRLGDTLSFAVHASHGEKCGVFKGGSLRMS